MLNVSTFMGSQDDRNPTDGQGRRRPEWGKTLASLLRLFLLE